MTRLSGFAEKAAVQDMEKYAKDLDCQLAENSQAILELKTSSKGAREALHTYLQFLDKYWSNKSIAEAKSGPEN
jgi:hypothetical protein